jgi:protein subunit release factor B
LQFVAGGWQNEKMAITKAKWEELRSKMAALKIYEEDLVEKFLTGSGKGGQKINTTNNMVYVKHLPTGLEVRCQRDRSREINRFYARRRLMEKIEAQIEGVKSKKRQEEEKIRAQKRRRKRKTQRKLIEQKRARSEVKKGRQNPTQED